jgi:hypothetical protein
MLLVKTSASCCVVETLDGLMRKMLADVHVLSTLAPAEDVVAPLDARSVVLVDRRVSSWCESRGREKVAEADSLESSTRSRILVSLSRGESNRLLQL